MSAIHRWLFAFGVFWFLNLPAAQAHLIVSQRGTLNIVAGGAYMVLSLPVSAFTGIDDDGDGRLSVQELRAHAGSIEAQVQSGVSLVSSQGVHALEGVMLNTAAPEDAPTAQVEQIVVMGRFPMDPGANDLVFSLGLFGSGPNEQVEQITVTRGPESQLLTLSPKNARDQVLPPAWRAFADQVIQGATHVLGGADHLLFLLVVLSSGWSFGKIVLALSSFTLGHAVTLVACVYFGLAVSPALVEPAIAVTIVGMALFDRWSDGRAKNFPDAVRLALVFGCALVHGLGLAEALSTLGLDPQNKWLSLAGFNMGIEMGQIFVALLAAAAMRVVHYLRGMSGVHMATRVASYTAVLMGGFWFVERVASSV